MNYKLPQYHKGVRTRNMNFVNVDVLSRFLFGFALLIHLSWRGQVIHIQKVSDVINFLETLLSHVKYFEEIFLAAMNYLPTHPPTNQPTNHSKQVFFPDLKSIF